MYENQTFSGSVDVPVVGGTKDIIKCSYSVDVSVLNQNLVTVELYAFPFVYSPVSSGETIGKAVIKYKEKEIRTVDITARENAEYYHVKSE